MKLVDIPEDIPVGFVIGKKGCVQKALQIEYNIRSRVDASTRKVYLSGNKNGVEQAYEELMNMFQGFKLNKRASYSHSDVILSAMADAPGHLYKFVYKSSTDKKNSEYPYVLQKIAKNQEQKVGELVKNPSILTFDDTTLAFMRKSLEKYDDKKNVKNELKNSSFTVKYLWKNDQWNLKRAYDHRQLLGIVDIALDNQTTIRTRLCTRNSNCEEANEIARNYIIVQGSKSNIFSSRVSLANAPSWLKIDQYHIKLKSHIEVSGLRVTFSHFDPESNEKRMECRLINRMETPSSTFFHLVSKLIGILGINQPESEPCDCSICFDSIEKSIKCPAQHSLCSDCFVQYVETELLDPFAHLIGTRGKVKCPIVECSECFSAGQILSGGPHLLDLYTKVIYKLGELEGVNSLKQSAESTHLSNLRLKIENAMNLNCPHCQAVFVDYDGCDAVTCSACQKYFCGLCLKSCIGSGEAHTHAATCGGSSSYYSHASFKERKHKELKQTRIKKILESLDSTEAAWVWKHFGSMFKDIGIEK